VFGLFIIQRKTFAKSPSRIGPENLFYLRDVKLVLEDAMPGATPYMPTHESRRYVNDGHLVDILRILRETKLRKLSISFFGRRIQADSTLLDSRC
jgi:hypothetical protein